MIDAILLDLTMFLDGVLAGVFLGSSLVEHAMRHLSAANWIAFKQAKEAVFGPVMPPFFGVGSLVTIASAILLSPHLPFAVAAAFLAGALAITVVVHLPLNKLFQSWSPTAYPIDWNAGRKRWRDWNWLRTLLALIAFGLIVRPWA